ncbi:hypothetical protein KSB_06620 [Ktedonobacter robiniae]|uniref:Secreted protein n=1 Tax=Ktedonobacter robiniae TaxID=2778365 RepID=A0ABQ3UHM0_9CHLR|nr:hypothetical protein KSB_06620 [Ktedonobacter robiniae]
MLLSQWFIANNVACGAVGTRVSETGKRVCKQNEQGDFTSEWPGVRMNVSARLKGIFGAQKGCSKAFLPIFSPITYYFCL